MVGIVTLSIELELGWGKHDIPDPDRFDILSPNREVETEYLERLLSLCDRLDIPITFDVVGHLLLEECTGSHDGPYPEEWFRRDPGTDVASDPFFYAPDLVESIREAQTEHEICTHTFSHIRCDQVAPELVAHELEQSKSIHLQRGLPAPVSFVPPRHGPPPRGVLEAHGIETLRAAVRSPAATWTERVAEQLRTGLRLAGTPSPVRRPEHRNGLTETYCSVSPSLTAPFLPCGRRPPHPLFRTVPRSVRKRIHRRALDSAVRQARNRDSYLHLWTHLVNLSNEPQWSVLEPFLESLADARDRGELKLERMADLASVTEM